MIKNKNIVPVLATSVYKEKYLKIYTIEWQQQKTFK